MLLWALRCHLVGTESYSFQVYLPNGSALHQKKGILLCEWFSCRFLRKGDDCKDPNGILKGVSLLEIIMVIRWIICTECLVNRKIMCLLAGCLLGDSYYTIFAHSTGITQRITEGPSFWIPAVLNILGLRVQVRMQENKSERNRP